MNDCPKCGSPNSYVGMISTECGYNRDCENFTRKQEDVVLKLVVDTENYEPDQLDFWDENMDSYLPLPDFSPD